MRSTNSEFVASRGEEALQLEDAEWIIDLAFLMFNSGKQKRLNSELRGEGETLCDTTRAT